MAPNSPAERRRAWPRPVRGDLLFALAVFGVYGIAVGLSIAIDKLRVDPMMEVAINVLHGHLDSNAIKGGADVVNVSGHYYLALGPLQLLPYLPFAMVPELQKICRYAVGVMCGVPAALLSLPLARAWGARGKDAYWIGAFTAFGSLLLFVSVVGDMYYLAHAESFLGLTIFLIEWRGRRRAAVLGTAMAFSFLARPTTVVAVIPFGLLLLWEHRTSLTAMTARALAFGAPLALGLVVYGWFNWLRFGSPFESGYSISSLVDASLMQRRAQGLFSLAQVPENLRLFLLATPRLSASFPFAIPSQYGMSMLLVSPALLTSLWAGFRDRSLTSNNAVLVLLGALPPRERALELVQVAHPDHRAALLAAAIRTTVSATVTATSVAATISTTVTTTGFSERRSLVFHRNI